MIDYSDDYNLELLKDGNFISEDKEVEFYYRVSKNSKKLKNVKYSFFIYDVTHTDPKHIKELINCIQNIVLEMKLNPFNIFYNINVDSYSLTKVNIGKYFGVTPKWNFDQKIVLKVFIDQLPSISGIGV